MLAPPTSSETASTHPSATSLTWARPATHLGGRQQHKNEEEDCEHAYVGALVQLLHPVGAAVQHEGGDELQGGGGGAGGL